MLVLLPVDLAKHLSPVGSDNVHAQLCTSHMIKGMCHFDYPTLNQMPSLDAGGELNST